MRDMFQDGWNSLWHVIFGILAYWFPLVAVIFVLYQLVQGTPNDLIDVMEFAVGFLLVFSLYPVLVSSSLYPVMLRDWKRR